MAQIVDNVTLLHLILRALGDDGDREADLLVKMYLDEADPKVVRLLRAMELSGTPCLRLAE